MKINREETIFDVLYSKQAFLNNKNIAFLSLSKMDRENVFADVLDKKKPLKTTKTTVYEIRKIRIFSNGVSPSF